MDFEQLALPPEYEDFMRRRGARQLTRYIHKQAKGEYFRVVKALEPLESGKREWHLSVSVAQRLNMETPPSRLPTDTEKVSILTHFQVAPGTITEQLEKDGIWHVWYKYERDK